MNTFQIKFVNIIYLSLFLIPNLINVVMPFILLFGLILSFIKLNKDKEIIAFFSLGLSLKEIKKPVVFISVFFVILYLLLNLLISPFIYDLYKKKEFYYRNIIDLKNLSISNFINIDDSTILDFDKSNEQFTDIFLSFKDTSENIIFSTAGKIDNDQDNFIFNLNQGFKLKFSENKIEKLEFDNYKIKIPLADNQKYDNYDKNAITIFQLIKSKEYQKIIEKIFDAIILVSIIILFYNYIVVKNNYNLRSIFQYIFISLLILINQNILKNIGININSYIFFGILNILITYIYLFINNYIKK